MHAVIPSAPVAEFDAKKAAALPQAKPSEQKLLDMAFLARIYRTLFWGGLILATCAAPHFGGWVAAASFAGGFVLVGALLKGQELFLRGLSAGISGKKTKGGALLAIIPVFKLALLIGFLYLLNRNGFLAPIPLGIGFFVGQLLVVARIMGRMISPNVRSVREVYIAPSTSSLR